MPLFEVKPVDREYYASRLQNFLPERIIDIHTHVWKRSLRKHKPAKAKWPSLVAKDNPIEDLIETYRLMLPGKQVTPMIFSSAGRNDPLDTLNGYVSQCARKHKFPSLIYASPDWSAQEFSQRVQKGKFLGAKVYLSMVSKPIPQKEIRIFDFLPPHLLNVMNQKRWIAMLHIPRDLRLRDPVNLSQMLEIENNFPRVQLIIAHVGRAYCNQDVGDAFKVLSKTKNMLFDISANTNQGVFEQMIRTVGPKRILFGSDMPILRMRMCRICEKGVYINLVPKGLYGDLKGVAHMRELRGKEADKLSFFLYKEIEAFRRAAVATRLSKQDVEDVFYNNAARVIAAARPKPGQLQMVWQKRNRCLPAAPPVPKGYCLRTFRTGEERQFLRVIKGSGMCRSWTVQNVRDYWRKCLPDGLFVVEHKRTGKLVATAGAWHAGNRQGPGGMLMWVVGDPAHKGKKLGMIVVSATMRRFLQMGYERMTLSTDDNRLPAIKTYLKTGWVPLLTEPGMKKRWEKVCKNLGIDFKNTRYMEA